MNYCIVKYVIMRPLILYQLRRRVHHYYDYIYSIVQWNNFMIVLCVYRILMCCVYCLDRMYRYF